MDSHPFDFIVKGDKGTMAVIEVKNRKNLTLEDAKKIRRNLMVHSQMESKYFILISQEHGYLWDNERSTRLLENPLIHFPMQEIISRYYKEIAPNDSRLRGNELGIIVSQWMSDLARVEDGDIFPHEPEKTLAEGGFIHSIHGATVLSEVQP